VRRVAAVDCGTNSIRLLVADLDPADGAFTEHVRRMEIVRLGEGVDRTGRIGAEALRRTLSRVEEYAAVCAGLGVEAIRFVATSASRDAENGGDFVRGVRERIGVTPEILTGREEAELSFLGATRGLSGRFPAPYLVVDLGGGSTEFVLGDSGVVAAASVDIGCVRLTERYRDEVLSGQGGGAPEPGPSSAGLSESVRRRLCAEVEDAVRRAGQQVPFGDAATLVGLAGTATTVAARVLGLDEYDAGLIHLAQLDVAAVREACDWFAGSDPVQRAALPYLAPGRRDVIPAGALAWRCVVDQASRAAGLSTLVVSEHDILDGVAWSLG